ncbi:unnamed protein product [Parnassius mnemosyne]|uniref:unspecific monooxygenase n=1 Tax=Parnassius mnemosyne TaxID=213953 RepID=A0AAV1M1U3_9NEOP
MIFKLLIVFGALCAIYYLKRLYNEFYWKKRGVKFYPKGKVIGPLGIFLTKKQALFEIFIDIYKMYPNEPAVGVGSILNPALYVKDPTNVQHVLSLDFNSFYHRGFDVNENDLLANNILFLNGSKWKLIRQTMTPLFTSSKLKSMYYIIDRSAQDFVEYLNNNQEKLKGDMFNTLSTFSSAAIGAAVFGIGTESIFNSPFLKMAQNSMTPTFSQNIKFVISAFNGTLYKLLRIKLYKQHEEFFIGAVKQVIRQREQEKIRRHDFADLCVNIQNNGVLKDPDSGLEIYPTDEVLAAQAFFFFIAGVEPSAAAMQATLIELGRNPDALKRVHDEIDSAFKKHNNTITYDIIQEMEYLEMSLNESMRIHPSVGYLTRECVRDTVLPVGNIKVEKGTKIFTPLYEFHHDSNIFPDPQVFKPERFSRENRSTIADNVFMPFGKGNRLCVGTRYATLQVKAGLVHLLRNFTVTTEIGEGGIKYKKHHTQVRPYNVRIELFPRNKERIE